MKTNLPFLLGFTAFNVAMMQSCLAQEPITIHVSFQPNSQYHYKYNEVRNDWGETKGMEDFLTEGVPNPATWKTTISTEKIFKTGNVSKTGGFPLIVNHHRIQELIGNGIYKEGTYKDSVIVFGTSGSDQEITFDSVALLPLNDRHSRGRSEKKIEDILSDYAEMAAFICIQNKKLSLGESFMITYNDLPGKENIMSDTITFTLLNVKDNIALLSFEKLFEYTDKTSHLERHVVTNCSGEIKVDLVRNLLLQRKQDEQLYFFEKMTALKTEMESKVTRSIVEILVEK